MSLNPKVTIVIPIYNGSNYMKEAIDSALNQTYTNIEVLVINDGSNDSGKTDNIARSYGNKIKYYLKENGGASSALNLGIKNMSGDYFSWLSHDDVYDIKKIEKQINYLQEINDDSVILYSDYEIIDLNSQTIGRQKIKPIEEKRIIISLLKKRNIHGCTLLIPKKSFCDVGLFNEDLKTTSDYDMWFRLIQARYKFHYIPGYLVKSRQHNGQSSHTLKDIHFLEKNRLIIDTMNLFSNESIFLSYKYKKLACLRLAMGFKRECLNEAADYVNKLAQEDLNEINFMENLMCNCYLIWTQKFLNPSLKRFLKIYNRLKIRLNYGRS